nr:TRIF [Rana dybowskii]
MLRNHLNTDLDDAPHTLRSDLCSQGISIPRPSHHSLSRISNALEISQSPNRAFIDEQRNSQGSASATQTPCTNIICNESSCCKLVPSELPSNLCTTNQEKYQQSSDHLCLPSKRNEEEVSEDKNTDGHSYAHSSQTFPDPQNSNLPEHMHELSLGVTIHKSNPFSEKESHLSNIFSSPDVLPLPSVNSSDQFFSFVILHAPEDQEIASRVCNVLEHHVVGKGTTFCETFETPGVNPLMCLEKAVENSAYIVLLLTNAFLKTTWTDFQSATVMMNSIENPHKLGSIIPFYPKLNKPDGKIPIWIKNLIPLDESSRIFETKVRNTFKKDEIKKLNKLWEKKVRTTSDFQQPQNILLQCSMSDASAVLSQQTQPQIAVFHGQTPVIQISHAGNVQIGNQNNMNIQFSPNEPQMDWDKNMYHDAGNETPN